MRRRSKALVAAGTALGIGLGVGLLAPGAAQAATSPTLFDCLAYEPTLMVGTDQHACTAAWQGYLDDTGMGDLTVDGEFGIDTEKATKHFQAEFGATQDGVVGGETWGWIAYSCDNWPELCSKQYSY